MWDALPIQRYGETEGTEFGETIDPGVQYPSYPEVCVSEWRNVDLPTRRWAMSLWCVHFGIKRCPIGPLDLFMWIPYVSTLVAKLGTLYVDSTKIDMATVHCNYVDPAMRGRGLAQKMILTMANRLSPRKFMFELQNVPKSLNSAVPFRRFLYVWIPQLFPSTFSEVSVDTCGIPGFHPDSWEGYRMFRDSNGKRILLDPHDDIVWCDNDITSVMSFHGSSSRYVRWFSPYGNICVYAQNMRFSEESQIAAALLV